MHTFFTLCFRSNGESHSEERPWAPLPASACLEWQCLLLGVGAPRTAGDALAMQGLCKLSLSLLALPHSHFLLPTKFLLFGTLGREGSLLIYESGALLPRESLLLLPEAPPVPVHLASR